MLINIKVTILTSVLKSQKLGAVLATSMSITEKKMEEELK